MPSADHAPHLVGVDHRVDGPDVVGVALQGREARVLGLLVAPRLLEAERLHAEHEALVGVLGIEGEAGAPDAVAQVGGVAEEEVELVADEQRQQVGGPPRQQRVELAGGAVPVARRPRVDRRQMGGLPLVEGQRVQVGGQLLGAGQVGGVGGRQRHVRSQDLAHGEPGLVLGQRRHLVDQVDVVAQQAIERRRRSARCSRSCPRWGCRAGRRPRCLAGRTGTVMVLMMVLSSGGVRGRISAAGRGRGSRG